MTHKAKEWSPKAKARLAGVFEALEGFTSSWGQVTVLGKLLVVGNATATAANILQHETLFRWGFVSSVLGVAFHLVWGFLFYQLFRPVNKTVSLCAAFVILSGGYGSSLFRAVARVDRRKLSERAYPATVAGAGLRVSQIEWSRV